VSVTEAPQRDITPTVRRTARRSIFWVVITIVLVLVAIAGLGLRGSAVAGDPLSPTNAAPAGSKALAEVLRSQGVDVAFTETLESTWSSPRPPRRPRMPSATTTRPRC
jgi:hypothetical protein